MKKIAIIVALLGLNFAVVKCAQADSVPASTDAVAFAEEVALDKSVTQEIKNQAPLPPPAKTRQKPK